MRYIILFLLLTTALQADPLYYEVSVDRTGNVTSYRATDVSTPTTSWKQVLPWIPVPLAAPDHTPYYRVVNGRLVPLTVGGPHLCTVTPIPYYQNRSLPRDLKPRPIPSAKR